MHIVEVDWTSLSGELWCTIFACVKASFEHSKSDLLYDDQAGYELWDFYDMRR